MPVDLLLAEDDTSLVTLFDMLLTDVGWRLHKARDGREALSLALEHHRSVQVIVSDYMMPFMTGDMLFEALQKHPETKDIPFLMVSATPWQVRAPVKVLPKPFDLAELERALQEVAGMSLEPRDGDQ